MLSAEAQHITEKKMKNSEDKSEGFLSFFLWCSKPWGTNGAEVFWQKIKNTASCGGLGGRIYTAVKLTQKGRKLA